MIYVYLKHSYLGEDFELVYPTIDIFCDLVLGIGPGALMFKRDLKRAFMQLPVDPYDYNLLGFTWSGLKYINTATTLASRSASMACQRTTNAISYLMGTEEFHVMIVVG